jgi:hypothetical protein
MRSCFARRALVFATRSDATDILTRRFSSLGVTDLRAFANAGRLDAKNRAAGDEGVHFRMFQGTLSSGEAGDMISDSAIEHTPDAYVLALRHPSFGEGSLSELQAAYADKVVRGAEIQLVDENVFVRMEVTDTELPNDEVRLQLKAQSWIHEGSVSTRVVPSAKVFGGWPAAVFNPAAPIRIMKRRMAFMLPSDIAIAGEKISFLHGSRSLDKETSYMQLMQAAKKGEKLAIRIGSTTYPLVFDRELDAQGSTATSSAAADHTIGVGLMVPKLLGVIFLVVAIGTIWDINRH